MGQTLTITVGSFALESGGPDFTQADQVGMLFDDRKHGYFIYRKLGGDNEIVCTELDPTLNTRLDTHRALEPANFKMDSMRALWVVNETDPTWLDLFCSSTLGSQPRTHTGMRPGFVRFMRVGRNGPNAFPQPQTSAFVNGGVGPEPTPGAEVDYDLIERIVEFQLNAKLPPAVQRIVDNMKPKAKAAIQEEQVLRVASNEHEKFAVLRRDAEHGAYTGAYNALQTYFGPKTEPTDFENLEHTEEDK